MSEMLDDIAYLSQEIGPRPAGTEEEQQASKYIANQLRKTAGLRAEVEEFSCDSQPGLIEAVCFGISVLMTIIGIVFTPAALVAFFVTLIVAVLYGLEFFGRPFLSRLTSRGISQNVVATYNPGTSAANRRRKIVIVANYDSDKIRAEWNSGLMGIYPVMQKGALVALVALPVLWLIRFAASGVQGAGAVVFNVIFIVLAILAALPVIFYFIARSATYNEAANDNASGVAALIELARRININAPKYESETIEDSEEADQETADGEPTANVATEARSAEAAPEDLEPEYDESIATRSSDESSSNEEQPNVSGSSDKVAVRLGTAAVADQTEQAGIDREGTAQTEPESQSAANATDGGREAGLLVEEAESPEQLKQESDQAIADTKMAAAQAEAQRRRESAKVPEWYRVAQEKAHRPESTKPVKRSRYADALDAAVAESSHHFEEAAAAVNRETSAYLNAFDRGIKEVAAPSDAVTRGAAQSKNPSSADMMRDAKERAEAAVRERTRIEAEEDAVQEQTDMEQAAIERAALKKNDVPENTAAAEEEHPIETRVVSRETVAFIDETDLNDATAPDHEGREESASSGDSAPEYIDEQPVEAESEYMDGTHRSTSSTDLHEDVEGQTTPIARIDVDGLRAEATAQNAAANDPVQRLQKAPSSDVQEAPKSNGDRIVYDETEETSQPYYDEDNTAAGTLETTKERIESGWTGLKNRVKKIHMPQFHRNTNKGGYGFAEDDLGRDDVNVSNEMAYDDSELNENNSDDFDQNRFDSTSENKYSSNASQANDDGGIDNQPAKERVSYRRSDASTDAKAGAEQRPLDETAQKSLDDDQQVRPVKSSGDDPNATIGIAPIHIDAAPHHRRNIDIPKVESTGSIPPVIDQVKQRAPLADAAERESETAAKSLLSSRIPRINLDGTGAVNDKIEMDNKKAALRNTLPSMSGSITMMPSNESSNNNTVSVVGSFASSAGTTGSFAPVGDELVADIPPEERYIDDADDSAYETSATETGAIAGPGYMEMPSKHRGLFGRRKKHKKEQHEQTAAQWLDVDENFNPTEVGAQRGGWESFQEDSEYERKQRKSDAQRSKKAQKDDGYDYEEWDNRDNWSDEWNGGAFSRSRAEGRPTRTSRRAGNTDDASEQQQRRRPVDTLPPEFADVARIANEMALESGDTSQDVEQELQQAYDFRNPDINCEVWFVALGAENARNAGIKSFLDAYSEELRGSIVINLEAVGAGKLSYLDNEGKVITRKLSTRVKRYLRMASQASGIDVQQNNIDWRDTAASIAMKRGLQAVTVVGMENGKPALMGQGDDVLENISDEQLNEAVDYVLEVIKNI